MRILFIGNFESEFSTENYHKRAFHELGHGIIMLQENKTNVGAILNAGLNCDMVYWTHTHGFNVGTNEDVVMMLEEFKSCGIPTVGYHLDLWMGLQRER